MALDKESVKISTAMRIAREFYDEKTYIHAISVAGYVSQNMTISADYMEDCVALAIMHDLLEDTKYKPCGLPENFLKALKMLTHEKNMSYDDYCKNLSPTDFTNYAMCAYWVKLADMKDHLNRTETLNNNLKEKYLSGLRYLL